MEILLPVSQIQSKALLRLLQVVVSPGKTYQKESDKSKSYRMLLHRLSSVFCVSWVPEHELTLYLTCREKPGAGVGYPYPGH